jgi:hypothetical protein
MFSYGEKFFHRFVDICLPAFTLSIKPDDVPESAEHEVVVLETGS